MCLQESHGLPVRQLLFSTEEPSCGNLFATVGGEQATVYDDMHMGDYIAVALNYVNKQTGHTAGGVCLLLSQSPQSTWSCPEQYISQTICWLVDAVNDFCSTSVLQSLQAMAWLSAEELTRHPNGDSFLVSCHQDCYDVCKPMGAHLPFLPYPENHRHDITDLSTVYVLLQAVAGTAGEIAIISLVEARVVSLLKGDCIHSSA